MCGTRPIIRTLNHLANAVVRLTGREPKDEVTSAFTREEVADLVAFLASDKAGYISGQIVSIIGGMA